VTHGTVADWTDYTALRRLVVSRPFIGKMISVQKVPRTCSVLVLGVPANADDQYISLCFEQGGAEVTDINRTGDRAIVTFTNSEGDVNVFML